MAPLSKCSTKTRPMPRVMAPAVTADTASPISAGPGIAKASADAAVTPKPVGTAPPINPTMMARVRSRWNGTL